MLVIWDFGDVDEPRVISGELADSSSSRGWHSRIMNVAESVVVLCVEMVTSQVSRCAHPVVQLQFFETVVRYDKFFTSQPQFLPDILVGNSLPASRISQCCTVVPHCCKGDAASQWEMAILGVSELRNPWTDRLKIWHTWLRRWADLVCQIS